MDQQLIMGKTISLRLATANDAKFIHSLRVDNKLNKHISKVTGTVDAQRDWLEDYKKRELLEKEFYFIIIKNKTSEPIGTVRVYGITDDHRFCWGSWILNDNKTVTSALESAYLVYKFAFETMNYKSSYFQVDNNNTHVISFHKKTGATFIDHDDVNHNFSYEQNAYENFKNKYINVLEGK
jgi:RimJ/RimL family protein N-acetyltransferase